jgi:hypothetical protein
VKASSSVENYKPENITDENVKTFWVAEKNDSTQWLEIDLQNPAKVFAIQLNYNDYHSNLFGRISSIHERYIIEGSLDEKNWVTLVDRSDNFKDVPNDYVELSSPQKVQFIRYKNIYTPTPYLSISDLRIFGIGEGKKPGSVKNFSVKRKTDRRDAIISWKKEAGVQGYNILWGIAPGKLYSSWMVYGADSLMMRNLNADQTYYFSIEAFNENGIAERTPVVEIK